MLEHGWTGLLLLYLAGGAAGALNVVAGGGSFLTLPLMIFLGLPPTVANGTNRVAILVQNAGAVWGFHQHRIITWEMLPWTAVPAVVGAVIGTLAAVSIGDIAFQRVLAGVMVAVSLWTIWDPLSRRGGVSEASRPVVVGMFFVVGIYGGFIQAGIGFLLLAATSMAGLDLVRGNALKVLVVLIFTPIVLVLFALNGKVDWGVGAALAAGHLTGGLIGVRLTVLKGHVWIRRVVLAAVIAFALKLWLAP